jgi:hypothetical protein
VGAAVVGVPAASAAPASAPLSAPPPQAAAATLAKLAESHAGIGNAGEAASTDIGSPVCSAAYASGAQPSSSRRRSSSSGPSCIRRSSRPCRQHRHSSARRGANRQSQQSRELFRAAA